MQGNQKTVLLGKAIAAPVLLLLICLSACSGSGNGASVPAPPEPAPQSPTLDLLGMAGGNGFFRLSGSAASGSLGVPVAAGSDLDGDGNSDFAMASMQASPLGRTLAGQVDVVFGSGEIGQNIDTAVSNNNVMTIIGDGVREATGAEIWMADVTGDGIGDLLIGRPNFRASAPGRIGAGAITIVVGGASLRDFAINNVVFDLRTPPASVNVLTIIGAAELDRLGFWMRTGDVTGDGTDDLVVAADQEDNGGASNSGAVYLIRGGSHLDAGIDVDLAGFGTTALAGHILKITPPGGSDEYHFGATTSLADLDDNGRDDILVAASLKRVGGTFYAEGADPSTAIGIGGNTFGSVFIVWDDNIPTAASWTAGLSISIDNMPMTTTRIDGGAVAGLFTSHSFGEEMIGGMDYNDDGEADVFFGDIWGVGRGDRDRSGVGHLFFSASGLKNRNFSISNIPADLTVSTFLGPEAGTITNDTTLHGDFDNDGIDDLAIASPLGNPLNRRSAGIIHVVWGRAGSWPAVIDFADSMRPALTDLRITDIYGAHGEASADDRGDTLMYSATAADMDGDGFDDLIVNEMRGNGVAATALDVGNLIILSGAAIPKE